MNVTQAIRLIIAAMELIEKEDSEAGTSPTIDEAYEKLQEALEKLKP